jgi:hypothetical protein
MLAHEPQKPTGFLRGFNGFFKFIFLFDDLPPILTLENYILILHVCGHEFFTGSFFILSEHLHW